jgi:hypothetical protein
VACDPCRVQVGKTANVRATARDEDGDALTYRWSSPQGAVANAGAGLECLDGAGSAGHGARVNDR